MSKINLMMERLEENKKIKYYCVDLIMFNPEKHTGGIQVSFLGREIK